MSRPKSVTPPPADVSFEVGLRCLMYYYQFNIGDYSSHTAHLDLIEDLAYRRMLDWCYLHERPLPDDVEQIGKLIRMRSHSGCISSVLHEFFDRTPNGWWKERIGEEIGRANEKKEKAKASANARWSKQKGDANALPPQSEGNAPNTHNPIPNTQDTINKEAKASLSGSSFPPCPHQEILKLWAKHLPHLAQPRVWEGSRQAAMRSRWVQAGRPSSFSENGYKTVSEGLEWWDSFFAYIATDTKLADGFESNGRIWRPDLEWVVNASNFAKIIDGKYSK